MLRSFKLLQEASRINRPAVGPGDRLEVLDVARGLRTGQSVALCASDLGAGKEHAPIFSYSTFQPAAIVGFALGL